MMKDNQQLKYVNPHETRITLCPAAACTSAFCQVGMLMIAHRWHFNNSGAEEEQTTLKKKKQSVLQGPVPS